MSVENKIEKRMLKRMIIMGVILLIFFSVFLLFKNMAQWSFTDKFYEMDVFSEDDHELLINLFGFSDDLEPELIKLYANDTFRDDAARLIFSVEQDEIMKEFLVKSFNFSQEIFYAEIDNAALDNADATKIFINNQNFYETGNFRHQTDPKRYIKQYASKEGNKIYLYVIIYPGKVLWDMVKSNGTISNSPQQAW